MTIARGALAVLAAAARGRALPTLLAVFFLVGVGAGCRREEPGAGGAPGGSGVEAIPESTPLARELATALTEESRFADAERVWRAIVGRRDSTPADEVGLAGVFFKRRVWGPSMQDPPEVPEGWALESQRLCEAALARDDTLAAAHYIAGVLAKEFLLDAPRTYAVDHLRRACALAPDDIAARYHFAVALELEEARDEAIPLQESIVELGEEFGGAFFSPALYHLSGLLMRRNVGEDRARGRELRLRHGKLPEPPSKEQADRDVRLGTLGRVRLPPGPPAAAGAPAVPARVTWSPPTLLLASAGAVRAFDVADVDGDHRDDLAAAGERDLRVALRCDLGFRERVVAEGRFDGVLAAELENGGAASLLAWSAAGARLFTPDRAQGFVDDSAALPPLGRVSGFVPVDFDHDGLLDLLVLSEGRFRLLRSGGAPRSTDGLSEKLGPITFVDVTEGGALAAASGSWATIEDFDGDHDVDLLLGGTGVPTRLLSNLRRGRFETLGSAKTGLPDGLARAPELGDFDHDSRVDVLVVGVAPALLLGRGDLTFTAAAAVPARLARAAAGGDAGRSQLADADLDGELEWIDAPLVTDFDFDGALDRLAPSATGTGVDWCRGRLDGAPRRDLLLLRGRKDNRFAVGAVIEARCGARYQRRYLRRPTQLFGFSPSQVPVVRITWPDGIVQYPLQSADHDDIEYVCLGAPQIAGDVADPIAEAGAPYVRPELPLDLGKSLRVVVHQKKGPPGSCPFLYSWDGARYVFVTDVLGTTPLGLPFDEQRYVAPDHDELVRMTSRQLAPTEGEYRLQLTEELRETTYLDRAQLWVVDHAADVEVHPEERFCFPPFPPQRIHAVRELLPLARVIDQAGRDWTAALAQQDDAPAVPFTPLPETWRGIATLHSLELTLPDAVKRAQRVRLLMTGWLQWGDASVNLAAAHNGTVQFLPPVVAVPDGAGGWRDCGPPVGFPAGKTKTMVLDVSDWLVRDDPRLRLTSTLELYWDQIRVAVDAADEPIVITKLEPKRSQLWHRGFSRPLPGRRPEQPLRFDWEQLEARARFDQHRGMLTREGDVLPLLAAIDDQFVILSSGDAIDLRFDASAIAPPRPGMERTFLLYLDGWAKDADPNTTHAQTVEPLPFHGMSGYPYRADERFPDDAAHANYQAAWNTRPGRRLIESLATPAD